MTGDSPNKFETIEQGLESLFNLGEVTPGNVLELSLQSGKELNEVLSLGMKLREVSPLRTEVLQGISILVKLLVGFHDLFKQIS